MLTTLVQYFIGSSFRTLSCPGKKKKPNKNFPVTYAYVTVVKLVIATPAHIWKDRTFFVSRIFFIPKKTIKSFQTRSLNMEGGRTDFPV